MKNLFCERTDLLVIFWFFGVGYIFMILANMLDSLHLVAWISYPTAIIFGFMYFYIPYKFNEWREGYCKRQFELEMKDQD